MSVTADDLQRIATDVWRHLLDQEVVAATVPVTGELTACVRLAGAFSGSVVLIAPRSVAVRAATAMFGQPAATVDAAAARDVFGELANIIAGHVKSLVAAPSQLALPEIVEGTAHCAARCELRVLVECTMTGPDGAFTLQVLQSEA